MAVITSTLSLAHHTATVVKGRKKKADRPGVKINFTQRPTSSALFVARTRVHADRTTEIERVRESFDDLVEFGSIKGGLDNIVLGWPMMKGIFFFWEVTAESEKSKEKKRTSKPHS